MANETVWDYIVFGIFLIGSTVYPLWSEVRRSKEMKTKQNYIFSNNVSIIVMMLSIARGTIGVKAVLGYPSELFYRGSGMWETLYGLLTAYPIVCFIFVPVYLNIGITSVYEYLDLRFHSPLIKRMASASFAIKNVLLLGVTIYTPCLAMNTIVGIPYWMSIGVMTIIGIAFTVFGNLKAAITADVIQTITITIVSLVVIIFSIVEVDGIETWWKRNRENGRLEFLNFTGDVTTRVDTLSAWLGQLFISLNTLGCTQNTVQRYLSMKSLKDVTKTLMSNIPFIIVLFSLTWFVGMGIYATYYECDPLLAGDISKIDEILPYYIEDRLTIIPGFLGIFLASLFNGALCIIVSSYNSLATTTWVDFLSNIPSLKELPDRKQLFIIKSLGVIYALLTMGVAYSIGFFSGIIDVSMLINSASSGPLVGVFLLAMLVPFANWKGAVFGMVTAYAITIAIIAGSFIVQSLTPVLLPTSIEGCENVTRILTNHTSQLLTLIDVVSIKQDDFIPVEMNFIDTIFRMTYMYYCVLGALITIIVGIIVSLFTQSDDDKYDSKLIHPMVNRIGNFITCNSSSKST